MKAVREYLQLEKKLLHDTLETDKKINKGLMPEVRELLAKSEALDDIEKSYDENSHTM